MSEEIARAKAYAAELVIKRCADLIDALAAYAATLPRPSVVRVLRETEFRAEYCATVVRVLRETEFRAEYCATVVRDARREAAK